MTEDNVTPITEEDLPDEMPEGAVHLDPEAIHQELEACLRKLDSDVKSGPDNRDLHNFVQDDLMPVLLKVTDMQSHVVEFLHQHDERLADIEDERGSQLMPEDAAMITGWIKEACKFISKVKTKGQNEKKLIEDGQELIGMIDAMTLSLEDEAEPNAPANN